MKFGIDVYSLDFHREFTYVYNVEHNSMGLVT